MTELQAVAWTARLLSWSLLLQSLELWSSRTQLERLVPWSIVRDDVRRPGLRACLDVVFEGRAYRAIIAAQGALALALPFGGAVTSWFSFALTLLLGVRVRGNYNGASDAMTLVVALGLAIARTGAPGLGLGYIAAQLVLSYFLAGCWKLTGASWRSGRALALLARAPQYGAHPALRQLAATPAMSRLASYGVVAFECSFPLAFLDLRFAAALLATAFAFHVLNALLLGLNRFLWAWLAAYPALWFWCQGR